MCTGIEILALVGAGVSAVGTVMGGAQQKEQAEEQAALIKVEGEEEGRAARDRAGKIRKAGRMQAGAMRASLAASGVEVGGEGTPIVLEKQLARDVEDDAWAEILSGGNRASKLRYEAKALKRRGKDAFTGSLFEAGGTVLSAGANYGMGKWKTSGGTGA